MSEYQYYEFQAIDKPLTENDRKALRDLSSRAQITATSFINEYNWGNFKGNPLKLMEQYFDAFLYVANWGTHLFMLRFPRKLIDLDLARQYCISDCVVIHEKGDHLIFEFRSETEDYEWEEGEGYLSPLISLRSDLIQGDYRCLYLGWLFCAQMHALEEDEEEPPLPPNLGDLSASLKSFADFLRIDTDLIQAAAENSTSEQKPVKDDKQLKSWIGELSSMEKDEIIFQLIRNNDPHLRSELLQRFQKLSSEKKKTKNQEIKPRTVTELLQKAEAYAKERENRVAKQKAREKARREKEAAIAREKYLNDLAKRENEVWEKIDTLILTGTPNNYDEAVQLLVDLRDLDTNNNTMDVFKSKLLKIKETHSRKWSLIRRMDSAGLL